ncbi:Deoxyribodipyrimidine photo-lyase [Enhygromyxa salina]|uniref:Deoxyribodipyrimidine photo-lyase n=1 Tax=Enhygromyxa salina TaxID=215803 RepID=A0A2S9XI88_9BACT|nr:deoxyribodipyrimidine photolyase [Enhygromyxa salina]PRP92585.1 Deoxyribodipyrimidine photo-lyase [Enhygromyxa salina]
MPVPPDRVRCLVPSPPRPAGKFVVYWMVAARRLAHNFALDRALELARELERPLLIFEALRVDYPWASDRFHAFVLDGMHAHAQQLADTPVSYFPHVETRPGRSSGLLEALAAKSCAVVTDDYPVGFLPRALAAAAGRLEVRLEAVDSNTIYPMRATDRIFTTAASFRRHLQKTLPDHLFCRPTPTPDFSGLPALSRIPAAITRRWPPASTLLDPDRRELATLPICHTIAPVAVGGAGPGRQRLATFLDQRLADYADKRNHPDRDETSGLSPYLHFGHIGAHEIFEAVETHEDWDASKIIGAKATGSRAGWWNMSPPAEAFLDQLITWRELGFNRCAHDPSYAEYETLPDWARRTLADHRHDPRPHLYSAAELDAAATHDEIWNAAQTQLVREGRIHNYMRMLWGKKILEWSASAPAALETMIELNDKYALDGRDPNSYSGIMWCFGRYDRAWGPERPIFGKVRYMSSDSTRRKLRLRGYLDRYAKLAA